jgi:pimeloyl-ACP methyl ester carboxylesterase
MREFENQGPRSRGPSVVWAGLDRGPVLVIVDPSGAAPHEELPATWHGLTEEYQVVWCRVPATDRLPEDVEDVLETLAQWQVQVDLVAGGTACRLAMRLAARFAKAVRSVLLVDPGPLGSDLRAGAAATPALADATWQVETLDDRRELDAAGARIRVVAYSEGGPRDRVPPPLPLGHPDVVAGVRAALREADEELADQAVRRGPARP